MKLVKIRKLYGLKADSSPEQVSQVALRLLADPQTILHASVLVLNAPISLEEFTDSPDLLSLMAPGFTTEDRLAQLSQVSLVTEGRYREFKLGR